MLAMSCVRRRLILDFRLTQNSIMKRKKRPAEKVLENQARPETASDSSCVAATHRGGKLRFSPGDYIAIVSVVAGFSAAVVTAYITIQHFKQSTTTSYIQRINNPEVTEIRGRIDAWLSMPVSDLEKLKALEDDKNLASSLRMFLNIITELGIAYQNNIVDKTMTKEIWNPLIPMYWNKLQFYIFAERLKGNKAGYFFEYLSKEIEEYNQAHKIEIEGRYTVPEEYIVDGQRRKTKDLMPADEPQPAK